MKMNVKGSLNKQIRILSVDSSAFYTDSEHEIGKKLSELYLQRKFISAEIEKEEKQIENGVREKVTAELKKQKKEINRRIKKYKKEHLFPEFNKNTYVRQLREDAVTYPVKDSNGQETSERKFKKKVVISVFDSELTRTFKIKENTFTDTVIIVEQYYAEVSRQIIKDGFVFRGKFYQYYSSSAGQIRDKKMVFVQTKLWNKYGKTLMCGLNEDDITANVNKLLAYKSLQMTASTRWWNFDIDRVIVCPDFEFDIMSDVEYIDYKTFDITRKVIPISMTPTDGAGMCLPEVSEKGFQFRMPYTKGYVSPFNFRQWAIDHNKTKVVDIDGVERDIIAENIQMILCKSMFKMGGYYDSWDEFKKAFKDNKCHAAIVQVECEAKDTVELGYQMLQSLDKIEKKQIEILCERTVKDIKLLGRDKDTMFKVLGVSANERKNYYQQALELMPSLLADAYSQEIVKETKKSMVNNAREGKIEVSGRYVFVCPDWWAYCSWLIGGVKKSKVKGLLDENEVYCKYFTENEKLDILRSPSLYREHGLVRNRKTELLEKWLLGGNVYLSHKSMLPKLLMLDWDGDQLACVNEPALVSCAETHMKGVVPLHYKMKKAEVVKITNESIFQGLQDAFKANIGIISNDVARVWDNENINLNVLKYLTMINNFEIDYAKTLFRVTPPQHVKDEIKAATTGKLPHLFRYAKDKLKKEVKSNENPSTMNRLAKHIPNKRIHFFNVVGEFDYRMLMRNNEIESISPTVLVKYKKLDLKKWTMSMQANDKDSSGDYLFEYMEIREELLKPIHGESFEIHEVVDMLIYYLYKEKDSDYKCTLWSSFGDIIVENIKRNQAIEKKNLHFCVTCTTEFVKTKQRQDKCLECLDKVKRENHAKRQMKYMNSKTRLSIAK